MVEKVSNQITKICCIGAGYVGGPTYILTYIALLDFQA